MNAKYVIIEFLGLEVPIVLPPEVEHRCVLSIGRPVSAGWCDPSAGWAAFGESLSLNLPARPDADASLLRLYFGRFAGSASNDDTASIEESLVTEPSAGTA